MLKKKKCTNCKKTKSINSFYVQSDRENRMSHCKDCFNLGNSSRLKALKLKAIRYMGGECQHCGFDGHYSALHFHHTRDKKFVWRKLRNHPWANIMHELDKCVLLCANCHMTEHNS